jgi:hypothetical protein
MPHGEQYKIHEGISQNYNFLFQYARNPQTFLNISSNFLNHEKEHVYLQIKINAISI